MTLMLILLTACATTDNGDFANSSAEPRVSIRNDATEMVTVSVLSSDGTLEVWFDDIASATTSDWADFVVDALDATQIVVHQGSALAGVLDLDYGNNTIVLSDDAEPVLSIATGGSGSGGGNDDDDDDDNGGGGWGW
jgi:hypothetical protein